jgi:hypothetical protein
MALMMLLKSWAMPPAMVPMACIFCDSRNCTSSLALCASSLLLSVRSRGKQGDHVAAGALLKRQADINRDPVTLSGQPDHLTQKKMTAGTNGAKRPICLGQEFAQWLGQELAQPNT